jgi:hypothetical protein
MANAYVAGGIDKPGIAFIDARLADSKFDGAQRGALLIKRAQAYTALKDWDLAAASYRLAHAEHQIGNREVLKAEGYVAEMREDWKTARNCYVDEVTLYDKKEEKSLRQSCINRLKRVLNKLKGELKPAASIDDLENGTGLQLDE